MTNTIFITGASGFIGSALLDALLTNPENKIFCLVRDQSEAKRLEKKGALPLLGSLLDIKNFATELCASEFVYHCAANASFRKQGEYTKTNIESTALICDILKQSPTLKRLFFLSTIGAVDRKLSDPCAVPLTLLSPAVPTSEYGKSKLKAEEIVSRSEIP